jgi:hypothetical protein
MGVRHCRGRRWVSLLGWAGLGWSPIKQRRRQRLAAGESPCMSAVMCDHVSGHVERGAAVVMAKKTRAPNSVCRRRSS